MAKSNIPLEEVDLEIMEEVAKIRLEMQKERMRKYKEARDAEQ